MDLKRLCRRPDWFDWGVLGLMQKKLPFAANFLFSRRTIGYCNRRTPLPDWSSLNPDLLEYIQKKLPLADVFTCRSVCRRWRSTTKAHLLCLLNPSPPVLLLRRKYSNFFDDLDYHYFRGSESGTGHFLLNLSVAVGVEERKSRRNIYPRSLCERRWSNNYSYRFRNKTDVPIGRFSHGWIVSLDTEHRICMSNLSSFGEVRRLRFPPIASPPNLHCIRRSDSIVNKLVFWGNPFLGGADNNYGMVVIFGSGMRLYFAKCGDTEFHELEHQAHPDVIPIGRFIEDIICINNRVYSVTMSGYIEAWDCSCDGDAPKKVLSFQPKWVRVCPYSHLCLVESQGELLLASINLCYTVAERRIFGVYKMDFGLKTWVPVDSLGDRVLLLLCPNQPMFLSTIEFPSYERNSIYFELSDIVNIFNLEDHSWKQASPCQGYLSDDEFPFFLN